MNPILVAPSILAADASRLGEEVIGVLDAGADWIHVDVMDGHFVPNLTMGPFIVEALRRRTRAFLDVHLMVSDPLEYGIRFAQAGANLVSFHLEAVVDPGVVIQKLRAYGVQVGLVINPGRNPCELFPWLSQVDLVLLMSVWAGFGGQRFLPSTPERLRTLSQEIRRLHLPTRLEVDGGIDPNTARLAREAGADTIVAGTAIFGAVNRQDAIAALRA